MKRYLLILPLLLMACVLTPLPASGQNSLASEEKQPQETTLTPTPTVLPSRTVNAETLNLRACPSVDCPTDPQGLKFGDVVIVLGSRATEDGCGVWLWVNFDNRQGWACGKFLPLDK